MTILLQGAGQQQTTAGSTPSGPLLLDLEADTLVLSDGDPVSTWVDQSEYGNDFTQTGTARPTYHTGGGVPYVEFDGIEDWMDGGDFADNLASFTVFVVLSHCDPTAQSGSIALIAKISYDGDGTGWVQYLGGDYLLLQTDGVNYWNNDAAYDHTNPSNRTILTSEVADWSHFNRFQNSQVIEASDITYGTVTGFSTAQHVRLGAEGVTIDSGFTAMRLYAIRIYTPAQSAIDRAAIEVELAARYGITL